MLYRDIQYQFGPLAPYWHAALFRLFGLHLDILYICGLLVALGIALAGFGIARKLMSPLNAWLAAVAVLAVFAFRPTLFNFVFPYSFSASYGLLWLVWSLWLGLERLSSGPPAEWQLWALGTLCGLGLLTKQEYGLAEILLCLMLLAAPGFDRRCVGRRRAWLAVCLPAISLPLAVYGGFLLSIGWRQLANANLTPWYLLRNQHVFYERLEMFHPHRAWGIYWWRLRQWWLPSLAWIAGLSWGLSWLEARTRRPIARPVMLLCLWLFPVWLWQRQLAGMLSWKTFDFYFWPFNLAALGGLLAWRLRRPWTEKERMLIVIFAVGMLLLARTPGNPNLAGYANLLYLPSALGWIYLLWEVLPRALTRGGLAGRERRRQTAALAMSVLLGLTLAGYIRVDLQAAGRKPFRVRGAAGEIRASTARGQVWQQTLAFLQHHPSPTLVAIPESAFFYVLANRVTPLPYDHLIPGYISGPRHERQALAMLRLARPRQIVIVQRDFPEYFPNGQRITSFGHAYDQPVLAWILKHYKLARQYETNHFYWSRVYCIKPGYAPGKTVYLARLPWS